MSEHRYILDSTRGKKYTCPSCGAKKSFRRYIDTQTGQYLSDECGMCDHKNSCGYHYPPRDYFRDHPQQKDDWLKEHKVKADWAKKSVNLEEVHQRITDFLSGKRPEKEVKEYDVFSNEVVKMYHSPNSMFVKWLLEICEKHGLDKTLLMSVYDDYQLGACQDGAVVFFQIDHQQQVRTGKIMQYLANGHRTGYPSWLHCYADGEREWRLNQCLYGEHLLAKYPDKEVGIVESEKSAIVCSLFHPEKLWLATGGCGGLNREKLLPLTDRKVTVYPDSGEFWKWYRIMLGTNDITFTVDSSLESYPPNTDIADVLLGEVEPVL